MWFAKHFRAQLKQEKAVALSGTRTNALIKEEWDKMTTPAKATFEEQAQRDKRRYDDEVQCYRELSGSSLSRFGRAGLVTPAKEEEKKWIRERDGKARGPEPSKEAAKGPDKSASGAKKEGEQALEGEGTSAAEAKEADKENRGGVGTKSK